MYNSYVENYVELQYVCSVEYLNTGFTIYIIGASLSEPHTSELVLKNLLRYMYIFRDVRSGTVLIRIYLIACSKISINQLAS